MHVFLTGATGLVGRRLMAALQARGDTVTAISRRGGAGLITADPTVEGPWVEELAFADAVVHLAGAGVFDRRWSLSYKAEILHSRVTSTAILSAALAKTPTRANGLAKVFISASAVGYYGSTEESCPESSAPGSDFLAEVCVQWEAAAVAAKHAGVRVVHPRLGIVLDPLGGALPKMARPFRFFVGGPIGNGRQGMSWIHYEDLTRVLLFLLDNPYLTGPVNAVAPEALTNREFCRALGQALHRPSWLPAPGFALRLLLGEGATVMVAGQRAVPEVLTNSGFSWLYPTAMQALSSIYAKKSN